MYTKCPVVANTLKIWFQFRQCFGFKDFLIVSPICKNHLFLPAQLDSVFSQWQQTGLVKFSDLFIDDFFASFSSLSSKYNLPSSHLFRYLQVRHLIQNLCPTYPSIPPSTGLDAILNIPLLLKGVISNVYNILMSIKNINLDKICAEWSKDLAVDISEETWNNALARVNGTTSCTRLGLIQFKVLHRLHYSKVRLSKIYANVADTCERCRSAKADLAHMFWTCPRLLDYWTTIFKILSEAYVKDIRPSFEMAVFGVPKQDVVMSKKCQDACAFACLLARRRILLDWKSSKPPLVSLWLSDVMLFLKLERIKYSLRGCTKRFYSVWTPMISYFEKDVTPSPN